MKFKVLINRSVIQECDRVSKIKNSNVKEMLELNNMNASAFSRARCSNLNDNLVFTIETYKHLCEIFNLKYERFLIREMDEIESSEYYIGTHGIIFKSKKEVEKAVEKEEVVVVDTPIIPTIFENLYEVVKRLASETRQLRAVVEDIAADNKRTADNIMLNGKAVDELTDEVKELVKLWRNE